MSITPKKIIKYFRYLLESVIVLLFYVIFLLIGIDKASAFGGFLARKIGIFTKPHRIALKNLRKCFPDYDDDKIQTIVLGMWDNLGRMFGEFPFWSIMSKQEFWRRVEFKNKKIPKKNILFLSGHYGNFELPSRISQEQGLGMYLIYRPSNNPIVDKIINHGRTRCGTTMIPKGKNGLKFLLDAMKNEVAVGMLVDQKMDDGVSIPFFGMMAKTTNLPAKLALKYGSKIIVVRMQRKKGAYFFVEYQEIKYTKKDDPDQITLRINQVLEGWIKDNPEQWFWVHNRWK